MFGGSLGSGHDTWLEEQELTEDDRHLVASFLTASMSWVMLSSSGSAGVLGGVTVVVVVYVCAVCVRVVSVEAVVVVAVVVVVALWLVRPRRESIEVMEDSDTRLAEGSDGEPETKKHKHEK